MPNANEERPPRPLPSELIPDFERFRAAIETKAQEGVGEGRREAWTATLRDRRALRLWRDYGVLLHERSSGLALIAKGDRDHLFTRHILDSLNVLSLFSTPPAWTLDIGSGGGLPGIPLAIAWPESVVTLVESRERKAGFLEQAARTLGLKNVRVVCGRFEDLRREQLHSGARPGVSSEGAVEGAVQHRTQAIFIRALGEVDQLLPAAAGLTEAGARWVYFLGSRSPRGAVSSARSDDAVETGLFGGRLLTGTLPDSSMKASRDP